MGDTMNTEVEVATGVSEVEEPIQEIDVEDISGPSKGFMALVVGGIVAVVVGVTVGIRRHKKKKAAAKQEQNFSDDDDFFEDPDLYEEEPKDVAPAEGKVPEKPRKTSNKKK